MEVDTDRLLQRFVQSHYKKDGRAWLHKSSVICKYGRENLIAGCYKKDSRVWLHKSSKKRQWLLHPHCMVDEVETACCEHFPNCQKYSKFLSFNDTGMGDGLAVAAVDPSAISLHIDSTFENDSQQSDFT